MAYALVAHTGIGSTDSNSITTAAIDTTGASLLTVGISDYGQVGLGTLTDSKGNVWTGRTTRTSAGNNSRVRLYDCISPTVGSGHTFTYTCTTCFPVVNVTAWSNTLTPVFDGQNGSAQDSGATVATGSVTPTVDNCLVVSQYMANDSTAGTSVNSGLTISDSVNRVGGAHFEGAMAYLIQTTATPVNATWTVGDSAAYSAAALAVYRTAAPTFNPSWAQTGNQFLGPTGMQTK